MDRKAAYVTVARILRPHGRRGEVAAEILTDFPQRLKSLRSVQLRDPKIHTDNGVRACLVKSCWLSQSRGGQAILLFDGANSIDEAKRLVGHEVQIPIGDRLRLPQGSYYVTDLKGCEVADRDGRVLGSVREVEFTDEATIGTPNLAVDSPSGELLIPLAQDICVNVNIPGRRITVILPDGLRELNARS